MRMIKTVWPEWNIEKEIGQGSYGTVYKCVNETKEYCAIKVISIPQNEHEMSEVISEKMSVEQSREYYKDIADDLIKEIEILKALKGTKNIVEIYDAQIIEKADGIGWNILIRMELLTDFNTYISDKQLGEKDVIKLGADLGNALSVCHKAKIIHRDIKPENILVDDEGNFKLGDFGVAKQMEKTQGSMSVKGTYNYMSPEVFAGKKCDGRADLYSLALVMYKLLNNNRLPFIDPNKQLVRYSERQAAFEKRINGEELPGIQGVSNELNAVILKACAFKPNDRQKDIEEFNKELGYLVEGKRIINKKLLKRIAIAAAVVVLLVSATVSIYHFSKPNVKEVESDVEETDVLKEAAGRKYNKIDYEADGQHLLYYTEYGDDDTYNRIPYLVNVEKETAVDVCELLGIDSENSIIGPRDEKYIYYAVAKDIVYSVEEYDTEVEIGYDLYRYNKETKKKELLLTSETTRLESIVYANSDNIYLCEYDDKYMGVGMGAPSFKKADISKKEIMPVGSGVAQIKHYNGYIFYTTDCGMSFWGYENLWIYDTYTNKNSLITDEWVVHAGLYFEEDGVLFEEVIIDNSQNQESRYNNGKHCIMKYYFETGERRVVRNFPTDNLWYYQTPEEGQVSLFFNQDVAIFEASKIKGTVETGVFCLNYEDGTYNEIEYPEDFYYYERICEDKKISDNILYLRMNDPYCELYEILPDGTMKQYGGMLRVDESLNDTFLCDSKMVQLTGDKKKPVKFYDFLEADGSVENMEFVELEEYESLRVIEDVEMRSEPNEESYGVGTVKAGEIVLRDAINEAGWSRILDEENENFYIPTEALEMISNTDTLGLCGERMVWEYNKETRELKLTGKGEMYWCNQGEYPWSQYGGSIKKVTISKGITGITDYAFYNCDSLKSITIPYGVEYIGSYAFSESESLTDVIIPDSVTTIYDDAFSRCKKLKNITIPDSVIEIGQGVFCECESLESIIIPYGVTNIYDYTFYLCTSLESVTIPDSVTSIGNYAFSNCTSLASITIPNSVEVIGDYAFDSCISLTSVTIPDSVVSLGSSAFYYCYSITDVKLSAGLTRINSNTFWGCFNMQSITIGSEVTDIGENAFYDCDLLTEVYYTGTKKQWNSIYIDEYNEDLTNCEIIYNA